MNCGEKALSKGSLRGSLSIQTNTPSPSGLDVSGAVLSSEQKLHCLISYHVSLGKLRSLLKAA